MGMIGFLVEDPNRPPHMIWKHEHVPGAPSGVVIPMLPPAEEQPVEYPEGTPRLTLDDDYIAGPYQEYLYPDIIVEMP